MRHLKPSLHNSRPEEIPSFGRGEREISVVLSQSDTSGCEWFANCPLLILLIQQKERAREREKGCVCVCLRERKVKKEAVLVFSWHFNPVHSLNCRASLTPPYCLNELPFRLQHSDSLINTVHICHRKNDHLVVFMMVLSNIRIQNAFHFKEHNIIVISLLL